MCVCVCVCVTTQSETRDFSIHRKAMNGTKRQGVMIFPLSMLLRLFVSA